MATASQMAPDLLADNSPRALRARLECLAAQMEGPFPLPAQMFLAAAKLQGFDGRPKLVETADLNIHIENGCLELNRGLTSTPGVSAMFYARQLGLGKLYPGTLAAHGHGIYFAEPSTDLSDNKSARDILPRLSKAAEHYARGEIGGIILRAAMKPKARTISQDDLFETFRNERNRAAKAGVSDLGTYAALIGYDAFYIDHAFTYCDERMWVVVNRSQLVIQRQSLQYAGQ